MTFKQILDKARENHIPAYKLMVATEVDNYIVEQEITLNAEEFETICEFVYDWVLNTSATAYEVIVNLFRTIADDDYVKFSNINEHWDYLTEKINRMF